MAQREFRRTGTSAAWIGGFFIAMFECKTFLRLQEKNLCKLTSPQNNKKKKRNQESCISRAIRFPFQTPTARSTMFHPKIPLSLASYAPGQPGGSTSLFGTNMGQSWPSFLHEMLSQGAFHSHGGTQHGWLGESYLEMDDDWGYPHDDLETIGNTHFFDDVAWIKYTIKSDTDNP